MRYHVSKQRWGRVLMVAGFVAGTALVGTLASTPRPAPQTEGHTAVMPGRQLATELSTAFEAAANKINPSVVPIFSEQVTKADNPLAGQDDPFRQFFGDDFMKRFFGGRTPNQWGGTEHRRGLGSGVIVSPDGYILTNNHVIDGADKITVMLHDKKKYDAKIIGRDPQTDMAVIKIDATNLTPATLANSDSAKVGEWVIAVGNPFELMHTVTAGIISATGRSSMNLADYEDFIQTDASINPGNSGGALADLDGNVIGINTAIVNPSGAGGNVGIGFAIPINMAKGVMDKLIAGGEVARGYLGLVPQDIDETLASALHLGTTGGALVADVTADGPAGTAGVKRGDIILSFNGKKVDGSVQLRSEVADAAPGSKASLGILRDGKNIDISVELGKKPEQVASLENGQGEPAEHGSDLLGLTVQALTPDIAQQLGISDEKGVVVSSVVPGGLADEAGVKQGDLVREVNRAPVASMRDFSKAVAGLRKGDSVALLIGRGSLNFYVGIKIAA
jgi:serine protease Do